MRHFHHAFYLFCSILCFPGISYANNKSLFDVSINDKSLSYLGIIFGPMGSLPLLGGNSLLGQMFLILTSTVLTIGIGVVAINTVISIVNTASEGEAMGHKWSSVWVPAKAIGGLLLLLPTEQGYAKIQVFVMWMIINSIGAANSLWGVVLESYAAGISMNAPAPHSTAVTTLATQLFTAITCMEYLNTQVPVTDYPTDWTSVRPFVQGNKLIFGLPDDPIRPNYPICGSFESVDFAELKKSLGAPIDDPQKFTDTQMAGVLAMVKTLQPGVDAVLSPNFTLDPPKVNLIIQAEETFSELLASLKGPSKAIADLVHGGIENGWILAGAYYYRLVSALSNNSPASILPKYSKPDLDGYNRFVINNGYLAAINNLVNLYKTTLDKKNQSHQSIGLKPSNVGGEDKQRMDKVFGPLMTLVSSFTRYLSHNTSDPLVAAATVGTNIMITCEVIWMSFVVIVLTVGLLVNILAVCQFPGIGQAFDTIVSMVGPAIMGVIIMLWAGGVTLGIYVPLVPYLVFTFASIGWMFEVIEAIVAAPLVALMLLVPSEDEWGKSSHSFMIYLGVLLRPSLMIIGFVAASKFLIVFIKFLNFGFEGTISSQLTGVGLFSSVVVIVIYAGIFIAIVHESFSLIYVLPDKIMRWIGGEGGSMGGEADMLGEAKQASDSAGETTQGTLKGVSSGSQQLMAQGSKKKKKAAKLAKPTS